MKENIVFETVVKEAWNNPGFKEQLIADPVKAVKELTGFEIQIPEGKTMVVVDQTDTSYFNLNIPPKPDMDDVELNEEQLEAVAGGAFIVPDIKDILYPPCFPPFDDGGTSPTSPFDSNSFNA
jgi:hypothetical protein